MEDREVSGDVGAGSRPSIEVVRVVMRMPEYAREVAGRGKLEDRCHIVGKHGGAWIYDVSSSDELEPLLATAPVYTFACYDVYPLAEMESMRFLQCMRYFL